MRGTVGLEDLQTPPLLRLRFNLLDIESQTVRGVQETAEQERQIIWIDPGASGRVHGWHDPFVEDVNLEVDPIGQINLVEAFSS